jgi:hypothetical protein
VREVDYLENPSVNERIILKWIFMKCGREHGIDLSGLGQGLMTGYF